jgi:hypothetical protein
LLVLVKGFNRLQIKLFKEIENIWWEK